jgi:putative transposase
MQEAVKAVPTSEIGPVCGALGLARATFYRHRLGPKNKTVLPTDQSPVQSQDGGLFDLGEQTATAPRLTGEQRADVSSARSATELVTPPPIASATKPRTSPRALSDLERNSVITILNEDRFCNLAPSEVFATLLDEGTYHCSERTMYRILADHAQLRERRNQLRHPTYTAPELMATQPNQLWSWDITKLKTFVKCQYFHLYVLMDVFSRYVVGWRVEQRESGDFAADLIETACQRQKILPGGLQVHADNGPAMISQPVASLFVALDIKESHSRPHVSDDNPFSEAQFKTLKYRPNFPKQFASIEHARAFLREFFNWYNNQHHHCRLALLTPNDVHHGLVDMRISARATVLDAAYAAHPERFVRKPPTPRRPPTTVWINPPKEPNAENIRV